MGRRKALADVARYLESKGMNEREISLALKRPITFVRRALVRRHPHYTPPYRLAGMK
jgi:hypothetical protein